MISYSSWFGLNKDENSMSILELQHFQVHTLKPLNIMVKNEVICLSGDSGAGKSLLLRAIADLIEHQGEALLDGKKCSEISPEQWRQWVGLLPAESAWWRDNVADHFTGEASPYFAQLNLPENCLTWDIARCSTGEKQRLALARLLENKPKVLLLDEPTASLDPTSVIAVEDVIKKYAREFEVPVIWVSHDQQQIKRLAERTFEIKNNEVIEVTA